MHGITRWKSTRDVLSWLPKDIERPILRIRLIEFQDTAKTLEHEFRGFIDAWDFGVISIHDIETDYIIPP